MTITRGSMLVVPRKGLSLQNLTKFRSDNTFINKDGEKVEGYLQDDDNLYLPRAYDCGLPVVDDFSTSRKRHNIVWNPNMKLWRFQRYCVLDVLAQLYMNPAHGGVLHCRTGGGKTVMALYIASVMKQRTVIFVDTKDLMVQWALRIRKFLGEKVKVAFYQGVKRKKCGWENADITIALVQSAMNGVPEKFMRHFGLAIYDEAHILGAPKFINSIRFMYAKYRLLLTATPYRSDKLEKLIFAHAGPIFHSVRREDVEAVGVAKNPNVYVVETPFDPFKIPMRNIWNATYRCWDTVVHHAKLLNMVGDHPGHNDVILRNIEKAAGKGRKILVISDRKEQLKWLHAETVALGFTGGLAIGDVKDPQDRLKALDAQVVFGTYQLVEKGLDCVELDTLFLATIRRSRNSNEQAAGRISRNYTGKRDGLLVVFRPRCNVIRAQVRAVLEVLDNLGCKIKGRSA